MSNHYNTNGTNKLDRPCLDTNHLVCNLPLSVRCKMNLIKDIKNQNILKSKKHEMIKKTDNIDAQINPTHNQPLENEKDRV